MSERPDLDLIPKRDYWDWVKFSQEEIAIGICTPMEMARLRVIIAQLADENARLREALAPFVVDNGPFTDLLRSNGCECRLCEVEWENGEPDRHADDCPVTTARAALEPLP